MNAQWISKILNMAALACAAIVFSASASVSAAQSAEQTMIVLDASGSMWGQIEGEAKVTIARRVLTDVLGASSPDLALGLMAYGHREKGQCSDIEVILEPKLDNGPAVAAAAAELSPLGKTPLSASVQQAAELLKYTEEKATVIVITDGIETCNADPCALGAALAQAGIDFTAHVVGFGLSAEEGQQVACLAQETGGLYMQADDAEALSEALTDRVTEIAEAPVEEVVVEEEVAEPDPVVLPEVSISSDETVEIGRKFVVNWDGPEPNNRDVISLFDPDARQGEGLRITGRRVINGDVEDKAVELVAPVDVGIYTLRYTFGETRDVLAETTIEVVPSAVSLEAPATVEIGRTFDVIWEGPGANRDTVQIIDPKGGVQGAEKRLRETRLVNGDYENKTVSMQAPAEPGFYRLQYWNGDNRDVIATREIEVLDAEVSLEAPDTISIGAKIDVRWVGPGARRDEIYLFDPNAGPSGKRLRSIRLINGDYDSRMVSLPGPGEPGIYELQYYNGDNRTVLATRTLEVVAAEVSLEAADVAPIGSTVEVIWTGPGATRDEIWLFDPNSGPDGKKIRGTRLSNGDYDARSIKMIMPAEPGTYELQYYNGDNRLVLAKRSIEIETIDVALDAPDVVPIGSMVDVVWSGPGATRDEVWLFDPHDGPNGKKLRSKRLTNDDYDNRKVRLLVPVAPGDYELRYYNGDSRSVLAVRPITVEMVDVALDGPATVAAGESFDVSWIGPGASADTVEVFDPNSGNGGKKLVDKRLTSGDYKGKTLSIVAPKEPGTYVLRYWSRDGRISLYETEIVVE